jgi:ribosomal protein S27AE
VPMRDREIPMAMSRWDWNKRPLGPRSDASASSTEERFKCRYGFFRPYVSHVIYRYLDFGDLRNGFARVRCTDCGHEYLLAFSCQRQQCRNCHVSYWDKAPERGRPDGSRADPEECPPICSTPDAAVDHRTATKRTPTADMGFAADAENAWCMSTLRCDMP